MSTGGGKPGSVQSDINVTPLIDVLLVLLIIFLVVMPIMMKMESLTIPRKIDDTIEVPDNNQTQLTVIVKASGEVELSENDKDPVPVMQGRLLDELRPKLEQMSARSADATKLVFVDFEDGCPWGQVVSTMDQIRQLAQDVNHDEIKVALKLKKDDAPAAATP
ncbi:MAG TPA: biopolymer transporter ExbD [Kofleriaceae bacterium]